MQTFFFIQSAHKRAQIRASAGLLFLGMLGTLPCHAQSSGSVEITGRADRLEVRVQDASVSKVLSELERRFGVSYARAADFNRQITGHYTGTLTQILARVLDGSDYILEYSDEKVRIVFLGVSTANARSATGPIAAAPHPTGNPAPTPSEPSPTVGVNPSAVDVPPLSNFLPGQGREQPR